MADIIYPGEEPSGDIGITKLPENVDFSMWQGDSQEFIIKMTNELGEPIPITGYTAQAVMRESFNSPTAYTFECTVQNVNEVRVYLSSEDAEAIPAGDYVWNFQLTSPSGDVRTYLAGDVKVYSQVD